MESQEAKAIRAAQELANHGDVINGAFGEQLDAAIDDMLPGEKQALIRGCEYLINELRDRVTDVPEWAASAD